MKYLITTLAIITLNVYANDHIDLPKPSECKGSPASYYVAKLLEGGTINGWSGTCTKRSTNNREIKGKVSKATIPVTTSAICVSTSVVPMPGNT